MKFLDMLRDSFRESLDRRSLIIVMVVSTVFILACASIGYEQVDLDKALKDMEGRLTQPVGTRWGHDKINARFEISDIKTVGEEPERHEFEGGKSFRVAASPLVEFQKLVLFSRALEKVPRDPHGRHEEWPKTVAGVSADFKTVEKPPGDSDMIWFVGAKLRQHNYLRPKVEFQGIEGDRVLFRVLLKSTAAQSISSGWKLSAGFGAMTFELRDMSIGDVVFFIQNTLAGFIAGWMGILIAIVATAAFVPNMVQKGTVDLLVARPIPRWKIYLYKYFGGLTYVIIAAGYLIVGSWFVIALRSGIWSTGYLMSWPLLVFFFAALYSVSALIGLLTRSAVASILISAVVWFVVSSIGSIHQVIHLPIADIDQNHKLVKLIDGVHAVLPRLKETDHAILLMQLKANGITPDHLDHLMPGSPYPEVSWGSLFGVTGAWMAGLLALGCWRFSRRDF